jgi:ceramide glucosyltransferase
VALILRVLTAQQQQTRMTQSRSHGAYWWLVPVKDVLDFALWAAALGGNHIDWRGERYRIRPGGTLARD